MLKVGFYDPKNDALVSVEDWNGSSSSITFTSLQMASMYQKGRHRMPSSVWLAFDIEDVLRVFFLEESPRFDAALMDRIKASVDKYRNTQ